MNFADLKKRSKKGVDLSEKVAQIVGNVEDQSENNFYIPQRDKSGNGYAIVRFLPAPQGESQDMVKWYSHSFQGPTGKWYIEASRSNLGRDAKDPLMELNGKLWQAGDQDTARKQGRRTQYFTNVYVIKDQVNPENEGKVMTYRFGAQIAEKIALALKPKFEDDPKFDPFDLWTGAALRIKITTKDKYPNYEQSSWDENGPLFEDDSEIEEVWKQADSLQKHANLESVKSYDELKSRLNVVLGNEEEERPVTKAKKEAVSSEELLDDEIPFDTDDSDSDDEDDDFFDDLDD